jgi:hypothetical protein
MAFQNTSSFLSDFFCQSLVNLFRDIQSRAKPEAFVLIVILPNSAGPIRNIVKHWGDVKYSTFVGLSKYVG